MAELIGELVYDPFLGSGTTLAANPSTTPAMAWIPWIMSDDGAGILDTGRTVFLGQRQHALNTAHRGLAVLAVHAAAERADLLTGEVGAAR